ncbi:MAG TPA: hypothetical protein VFB99_02555 [Vicinamibacterales bacterium]|nr:hypothetical protein [Vicinamibacterales bacterium]
MSAERYPLSWPVGWKRTPANERQRASFAKSRVDAVEERNYQTGATTTRKVRRPQALNSTDASERLEYQLDALGASDAVLSTNQRLTLSGRPASNQSEPVDPGAAVYFRFKKQELCLACDRWTRVADNIAALAAHIDAIRRQDRYGVGSVEQAFAGYQALPAKGQTWRTTLGFSHVEIVDAAMVERAFRERAKSAHPDIAGGSHDAMASLTAAKAEALQELRS